MLELAVHLQILGLVALDHMTRARVHSAGRSRRDDAGQTTAEYALVLLAAAAVALLVIAWATRTNRIGRLFDFVIDQIIGRVT